MLSNKLSIKSKQLISVLQNRAISTPHKLACLLLVGSKDQTISITYYELDQKARAIAAYLQSKTLFGQRVLLLFPAGLDFITAFIGCLYAGVIAVPLNALEENEIEKLRETIGTIADHTNAVGILMTQSYMAMVEKCSDQLLVNRKLFLTDIAIISSDISVTFQIPKIYPDTIAYLQYTSGSTTQLKAAVIRHKNLNHNLHYTGKAWNYNKNSVSLTWALHFHIYGLIVGLLVPLYYGALAILMPLKTFIRRPINWLEAITQYRVTHSGCPNFGYDFCVRNIDEAELKSLDLTSWKVAVNGGEHVNYETITRFSEKFAPCGFRLSCFRATYGMSELTGTISTNHCGKQPTIFRLSIEKLANHQVVTANENNPYCTFVSNGRLLSGLQAKILDPDTLMPVTKGRIGEIWLAGKSLVSGYWENNTETKASFYAAFPLAKKFYFRTGDLGFIQGKELCVTGRIKELIIIYGKKYYPADLEMAVTTALSDLPVNYSCIAFSLTVNGKEEVIIVQEINETCSSSNEIIKKIRHVLAKQYGIKVYQVILVKNHSLPKTGSGKLQRIACQQRFLAGTLTVVTASTVAPFKQCEVPQVENESIEGNYSSPTCRGLSAVSSHQSGRREQVAARRQGNMEQVVTIEDLFYPDFIKLISQALKINAHTIDLNRSFSEFSIDSINIIQLTTLLNETYHLSITPNSLFEYFTLAEFFNDLLDKYAEALNNYYSLLSPPLKSSVAERVALAAGSLPRAGTSTPGCRKRQDPFNLQQPIAIIGISGIFPGAADLDTFWNNLMLGKNAISEIPKDRWNWEVYDNNLASKWGGFVEEMLCFDADFFNISPREAELADPQQRVFLQIVWKAIEDAGYTPADLARVSTGLFVGVFSHDYAEILQKDKVVDAYVTTGTTHSVLANRVSYLLNLHGPSVAIDTACSSSLVAIHQAVQAIQNGDCAVAIAGGVNALLSPTTYLAANKAGMLSEDGACKTFDSKANGYVRGEGAAAILLKPLLLAKADGDHIYGVIKGTAVNHGGHVNSLTAPNPHAQAEVIMSACRRAGIIPEAIRYIETHGTGTILGDPIEINGLKKAFANLAEESNKLSTHYYCGLGAVKTHIGHLEAAAGIVGVIKVLLAMQHKQIPANLHFKKLNPYINLTESPFYIANTIESFTNLLDSQDKKIPLCAGVSSFGFGGTNAHIIIEEAIQSNVAELPGKTPYLFVLSAKTNIALQQKISDLYQWVNNKPLKSLSLAAISYTLNLGRVHFSRRCAFVVDSLEELQATLGKILEKQEADNFLINPESKNKFIHRAIFQQLFNQLIEELTGAHKLGIPLAPQAAKLGAEFTRDLNYFEEKNSKEYSLYFEDFSPQNNLKVDVKSDAQICSLRCKGYSNDFRDKLLALGSFYVEGYDVDWSRLYVYETKQRISLPTYPFAKEYYGLSIISAAANHQSGRREQVAAGRRGDADQIVTEDKKIAAFHSTTTFPTIDTLQQNFKQFIAKLLKKPITSIEINASLNELGLDSITLKELSVELENYYDIKLNPSIFFTYQTIQALSNYLLKTYPKELTTFSNLAKSESVEEPRLRDVATMEGMSSEHGMCALENEASQQTHFKEPIAIIGLSGTYPMAKNIDEFWLNLIESRDCITEIPIDRWDYKNYPVLINGEEIYFKYGGFIADVDKFDPLFFNISPREAALIDPQERLFLQSAWTTIEDAGYTREKLQKSVDNKVGVFVGISYNFYPLLIAQEWSKGNQLPLDIQTFSVANRVSYFLNLTGPSLVIDTACSSSLSAIHLACESIANGECIMAIAGGVNLSLHPCKYHFLGSYGFISPEGQCASFAKGSSGYVPAEGVGSVLLKPLSLALKDNDRIYAVIKASSMNHGGKTIGYTTPNPNAQAALIKNTLEKAKVSARSISYIEAHGTGTTLGDPIEIKGLEEAFAADTQDKQFCAIGSVKSNIGHLEAAAGISQLTKVLLQLRYKKLVPSLHAEELNPYIDFADTPFFVQRELSNWQTDPHYPRRAGISSFGAGGTNVHLIIEEFQAEYSRKNNSNVVNHYPLLFLLSAANKERLYQYTKNIHAFLVTQRSYYSDEHTLNEWLQDVCYTSQVGRESMGARLAIAVTSYEALIEKLAAYIQSPEQIIKQLWINYAAKTYEVTEFSAEELVALIQQNQSQKLAELWIGGAKLPWQQVERIPFCKRVFLPTYPFEQRRCWVASELVVLPDVKEECSYLSPTGRSRDLLAVSSAASSQQPGRPEQATAHRPQDIGKEINQLVTEVLAKSLELNQEEIHPNTLFHEYGLDSMIGIHFINELSKFFPNTITPMDLYRYSTIEKLSEYIAQKQPYFAQSEIKQLSSPLGQESITQSIAIVGLSCRFPQANNKEAYWQLLAQGKDVVASMPEQRWKLLEGTREAALRDQTSHYWGSYLSDIDQFDTYFFGISPREATFMEPEQRGLLEVTYEAILDAGLSKETLSSSNTGVFLGLDAGQFAHLQKLDGDVDALYLATGNATSIAANRISYLFDLHGPSMVVDTACSASLVALHLACLNLQNQLCDLAIVGGANINLLPSVHLILSKAKMFSSDGKCKTFSADAAGYAPGEGIGVVVLKPLDKAIQDKDRIYAVIAGTAVNQDGKTNGLTAPNGLQQEALLERVYTHAGIKPEWLSYVECHGTGTFLGDPIEVQALGEAISKNRTAENPCWIASVKTNIGHLEPAAGIAGLIKVALALEQKKIPPHLHFATPNPHIAFDKYHFRVPTQLQPWPKYGAFRVAGVSAFGFGGTNAHAILRELSGEEQQFITQKNNENNGENHKEGIHIWQHKSYWPNFADTATQQETNLLDSYPLQGTQIFSPLSTKQFAFKFSTKWLPEIPDTYHIIHVGYYLDMLAFAIKKLYQQTQFTVQDLVFLSPIMVPDNVVVQVQLVLQALEDDVMSFSFYSNTANQTNWTEHAKGRVLYTSYCNKKIDPISVIKQRCSVMQDGTLFYQRLTSMGLPVGNSIRWTQKYWLGENEILCEFHPPKVTNKGDQFVLNVHPGIIDASIQSLFPLLPSELTRPFIADGIKIMHCNYLKDDQLYLLASLKTIDSEHKKITGDWSLIKQNGEVVIECQQISLTQIDSKIDIEKIIHPPEQQLVNLSGLSRSEAQPKIIDYLTEQIAIIFSMPKQDIDIYRSLQQMGIDSLMALVLVRVIETGFAVAYSVQDILQGASIIEIVETILSNLSFPQRGESTVQSTSIDVVSSEKWIAYRQKHSQAKTRLFCFPYGGGGASIYRDWQKNLPDDIEVCPIQLPGREGRMGEQPIIYIDALIDDLIKHLQPEFDLPFAIFGHSFGSLIAFAMSRRLRQLSLPLPIHLFVSAYPDPRIPTKGLDNLLHQLKTIGLELFDLDNLSITQLSGQKLMQLADIFNENGVFEYGRHLISPEIMRLLLPIFIGDMWIVKSYIYQDETPFDLPISVFLGQKDTWIPYIDHLGWAAHTRKSCQIYEFNSGHLFIKDNECKKQILNIIVKSLNY